MDENKDSESYFSAFMKSLKGQFESFRETTRFREGDSNWTKTKKVLTQAFATALFILFSPLLILALTIAFIVAL